jgi:hypothetical protein
VYVAGDFATYHNNLHMHHRKDWLKQLETLIAEQLPDVELDLQSIRVFFWQHAIGFWAPNARGASLMNECIIPHPLKLPGLICVGEQYSEIQGWAEGALQTVETALPFLLTDDPLHRIYRTVPKNCLVNDGRVVDVADWFAKHPGGRKPLRAHMNDYDITDTFRRAHLHAPYVNAHMLSLQKGFIV